MSKRVLIIAACIFTFIIAVQSIIHAFAPGGIIVPDESISFNIGHAAGTAANILGSIGISIYFLNLFGDKKGIIS